MHLGLKDGPSVLHNLISAQESHVPLLQFQMDFRLKILMSSGSNKEIQICYFFSLKKSRQMNPLQVSNGAPMGRDTRLQGAFKYLSKPSQ